MDNEGGSEVGSSPVALARSSPRCETDYHQALPFVTYASTDLEDGEAEEAMEAVGIDLRAAPRPLAFMIGEDDVRRRLEALVAGLDGRFLVTTYERLGIAAHRLASIVLACAATDGEGTFRVGGRRDRLESMLLKTLRAAAVDHDVEEICKSCAKFTMTPRPDDLPHVLPEFEDTPLIILEALLPQAAGAVGAALKEWGKPDRPLHGAELAEALDRQATTWRRRLGWRSAFATSDADAGEALSVAMLAESVTIVREEDQASMRLAALLAETCSVNSDPAMAASPLLAGDFGRHDAS